jgi:hypothetical protein
MIEIDFDGSVIYIVKLFPSIVNLQDAACLLRAYFHMNHLVSLPSAIGTINR